MLVVGGKFFTSPQIKSMGIRCSKSLLKLAYQTYQKNTVPRATWLEFSL